MALLTSAPELAEAVKAACRADPSGRHVFEIGEGLGFLSLRNMPVTMRGRVEIVGGSLFGAVISDCGAWTFRGVRFYGQQDRATWGSRFRQVRFNGDAHLMFDGCSFESEGEPWNRPDGAMIDRARSVRFVNCRFRGLYNGVSLASVAGASILSGDFRQTIGDAIAVRNVQPGLVSRVALTVKDTLITDVPPVERSHSDAIQITSAVPVVLDVARNVFWAPGRSMQGIFTQTHVSGSIAGNDILTRSPNGVSAYAPDGLAVVGNRIVSEMSVYSRSQGRGARIYADKPGMTAAGNVTAALSPEVRDAGGNIILAKGAYEGRLRGPWTRGEWGDVLASPPPLDAPASVIKGAIRRALSPV